MGDESMDVQLERRITKMETQLDNIATALAELKQSVSTITNGFVPRTEYEDLKRRVAVMESAGQGKTSNIIAGAAVLVALVSMILQFTSK